MTARIRRTRRGRTGGILPTARCGLRLFIIVLSHVAVFLAVDGDTVRVGVGCGVRVGLRVGFEVTVGLRVLDLDNNCQSPDGYC